MVTSHVKYRARRTYLKLALLLLDIKKVFMVLHLSHTPASELHNAFGGRGGVEMHPRSLSEASWYEWLFRSL